ncbi:hypothetical protein HPB50_003020 [Hyalomma asiaticum]|uniref:Uncharacterized protein n=1 Tax=Hyalomma asiaticum TaxID=266040 RepID=A0ACB7TEE7_HYAAI|nr:hypothetical protein HPB50_003020 [Hyalomma asiaticum]
MSRRRFVALLAMLHISDPEMNNGAAAQKLDKVSWLIQHINDCSAKFFQPSRELSVDERMVKSKARSGIRQYIRDKVVNWGYKLWVLADPKTGYTIQFIVYTGKREKPSANGLAFDVVTKLCDKYTLTVGMLFTWTIFTHQHRFFYTCWNGRLSRVGPPEKIAGIPNRTQRRGMGKEGEQRRHPLAT